MSNKAILVVSFGTSYSDTRKKTIDAIEADIQKAYPDYKVYRAFTSKIVIKILKNRDAMIVHTVKEAMEQMKKDGIEEVVIQPTHIINGIENDRMLQDSYLYKTAFKSIKYGVPLLNVTNDYQKVIKAFVEELPKLSDDEAVICMGHGTEHYSNSAYAALDYMFKDFAYDFIYVATVEGYPELQNVIKQLKKKQYKKITLIPFMMVAGDHAQNDMAGEDEDSWKNSLEKEGYQVQCILKGLGEYTGIRKILIEHISQCLLA